MTTCIPWIDGLSMDPLIKASREFLNSIFKYFQKKKILYTNNCSKYYFITMFSYFKYLVYIFIIKVSCPIGKSYFDPTSVYFEIQILM